MFEFSYIALYILIELGAHVGSSCTYNLQAWHTYLLGKSMGRFTINITYTLLVLQKVFKLCVLLFLHNRKIIIADNYKKYHVNFLEYDLYKFAVTYKQISSVMWYPGLLTNIKFFSKLSHKKVWKTVHFNYGKAIPSAVFLLSLNRCYSATHEGLKLGLPLICVVDTVGDPSYIDYPVFSNTGNIDLLKFYITIIKCAWYVANILKVTKKSPYIISWISMKNKFEILRDWINLNHFTNVTSEHNPLAVFKRRLKRKFSAKVKFNLFYKKKKKYFNFFNFIMAKRNLHLQIPYPKFFLYRRFRSIKTLKAFYIKSPIKKSLKKFELSTLFHKQVNKNVSLSITNIFVKNNKIMNILLKNKKFQLIEKVIFSIVYFLKRVYLLKNFIKNAMLKYSLKSFTDIFHFLLDGIIKFTVPTTMLKDSAVYVKLKNNFLKKNY